MTNVINGFLCSEKRFSHAYKKIDSPVKRFINASLNGMELVFMNNLFADVLGECT